MVLTMRITETAKALLSKILAPTPFEISEKSCHDTGGIEDSNLPRRRSRGSTIASDSDSAVDLVPGVYSTSLNEDPDKAYTDYLQHQKEVEDDNRLERQTSKQLQEQLELLRQQAIEARCQQAQEIKHIDKILRDLAASPGPDLNGMVGPAPAKLAFYGRSTFVKPRFGERSGMDIYGSAPPERDSPLSYAFRGNGGASGVGLSGKKLSLYESAPGSRWPKRLSAERNCGFKSGAGGGLRKDAVIAEEDRVRKQGGLIGREGRIPVPTALAEAMRRGQVIAVDGVEMRKDGTVVELNEQALVELVDDEDAWETEEEEDERAGKTSGVNNIKIQRRVAEKVDDIIVRQVGVKKWSLEEHMRKKQRKRRASENVV